LLSYNPELIEKVSRIRPFFMQIQVPAHDVSHPAKVVISNPGAAALRDVLTARAALWLAVLLTFGCATGLAGPPFQTDDPEPVEFRHYEFYLFGNTDSTPIETDIAGPAAEFN